MGSSENRFIYTIGHSTHPVDEFIEMLQSLGIELLADIRRFPGSRKFPEYNRQQLEKSLKSAGIRYVHLPKLGGRRPAKPDSKNTRWRNKSFRGYADYMETNEFNDAIKELETLAAGKTTAYMCAEAVWWRCHRSMVSDVLKARGWTVSHIMAAGKSELHPYTSPAQVVDDQVFYKEV